MNFPLTLKTPLCLLFLALGLYLYLAKQNEVAQIKLKIPTLQKQVETLQAENTSLLYTIEKFENPNHLMQLLASPDFTHLKHPLLKDVIQVQEGIAVIEKDLKNFPEADSLAGTP